MDDGAGGGASGKSESDPSRVDCSRDLGQSGRGGPFPDIRALYPNFDWEAAEARARYYDDNSLDPPTAAEIQQQKAQARAKALGEHLGLINALMKGNRETVMKLINGVNVNSAKDEKGYSCLHLAVVKQDPVLVEHMLQLGAWVEERDRHKRTPLLLAVEKGGKEVVQKLLEADADVTACDNNGNSVLHHAAANNKLDLDVIRQLMKRGARPDVLNSLSQTPLRLSVFYRGVGFTEKMILAVKSMFNFVDTHALFAAVESGQEYLVKLLLNLGLSANLLSPKGLSLLYNAMFFRLKYPSNDVWIRVLKLLLKHGADAVAHLSNFPPIIGAIRFGNVESIKLLMERGVDLKNEESFYTPLLVVAAHNSDVNVMKYLISQQVHHIDRKEDVSGNTALIESVDFPESEVEIVEELLRAGSNVDIINHSGYSSLHCAIKNNSSKSVNLLLRNGAKIDQKAFEYAIDQVELNGDEIIKHLILHLVLRKSQGLQIDDKILKTVQKSLFLEFFKTCEKEIDTLHHHIVCGSISLYDILTLENPADYAKNEDFMNTIKDLDIQQLCSIYADLIKSRLVDVKSV